ncbi:hypothetical protein [Macrococcus equipercicus]|uniref:Superantigen-like protein n=1 Tax=Macrococcus equipercicus TaxID=69967 RepID=A0A9Q9BVX4_9STAP|nr:hypothetical protein [Macrococcus equipercicus]UTH14207.1 hypothetical protein KFV11_02255 [Macrococcus equipercicus]
MKKFAVVALTSALFVTPLISDNDASAATRQTFKAPDLLNTTVARQLKAKSFIYKSEQGKIVKIGDTFKTVKYQWGRPSYFSTYSISGNSSFEAGYGKYPTAAVYGSTNQFVYNFNSAKVDGYKFWYLLKYSPTAVQKVYGKPTTSQLVNKNEIKHYYKNLFELTYHKNSQGSWRVFEMNYHLTK